MGRCELISNFNLAPLKKYLNYKNTEVIFQHPYQSLSSIKDSDMVVVWLSSEFFQQDSSEFLKFVQLIKEKSKYTDKLFLVNFHQSNSNLFNLLDMRDGVAYQIIEMNLRLIEELKAYINIYLIDSSKLLMKARQNPFSPESWYMGKIPYSQEVFKELAQEIKSSVQGIMGLTKKIIILDLDNTLWGGVIGDDGIENITLGGHNTIGEAFVDFQKAIKEIKDKGFLLAVVSKNDEKVALHAIENHPEMIIKKTDLVGWRINWKDKASNIVSLMQELNLGLDSAVFLDDNFYERERVKTSLPDVYVPDLPNDKTQYATFLRQLRCFNISFINKEDTVRTKMYQNRKLVMEQNNDDWLNDLQTEIKIEEINEINFKRTLQLLNKTNQMNLRTQRFTEKSLKEFAKENKVFTFTVSDKYGSLGLVGVMSLFENRVLDFVLSCRAFGRKIEHKMLDYALGYTQSNHLILKYYETKKNKPCLDFISSLNKKEYDNNEYRIYEV